MQTRILENKLIMCKKGCFFTLWPCLIVDKNRFDLYYCASFYSGIDEFRVMGYKNVIKIVIMF